MGSRPSLHSELGHWIEDNSRFADFVDTAELLSLGAILVRPRSGDSDWDGLADPEGNEFCVFAAPT
jgi:hypothetical protein